MSTEPQQAVGSFSDTLALGEPPSRDGKNVQKKRVVVTGGSGKLGRATVRELASHGWDVINFDRVPPPPSTGENGEGALPGRYLQIDLTDMGQVMEALSEIDMSYKGVDAVVHLAALPAPGQTASSFQFQTNTMSTYNILEASRKNRIKNLVLASSETLIGLPLIPHPPAFLPITEESERRPESAYSLSKLVGEEMAGQYARWDPELRVVSLRFSNVMLPEDYKKFESWQDDPHLRCWNAWGYIDARDGAQAIRLSLESTLKGHHQFLIANEETVMRTPNADLIKAVFPDVPYEPTAGPNDSLLSIRKAKDVLGFKPKFGWREQAHGARSGVSQRAVEEKEQW
ncbi:NAD(P)-binding protein [Sistotremastrum suecicum HHB10207 ss-3]|uniref:NAD(P)-binding protein n=1 Tax=Sistotremastrum suecicum HHB10207 ss-3 TaxID=1314776 RepID=A0A166CTK7_9AGAM|nr:NAD(P)-binding protein [Sistotremastrum suecicum HHB10207 ss-3]